MRLHHEYTTILRLGLPILLGQLGSIATGFVDNIMVGHYSTDALAAASFCNNVFNCAILACLGFTYGITPLVGALYSRDSRDSIGALMRNAVAINVLFCLLLMAVMAVLYLNVHRLGQPEELMPLIRPYFLTCLAGMLPLTLFSAFSQWSYGINNTMIPMWIVLGSNVLNIAGNYLLIFGIGPCPELGLTGAGLSTLLARVVCPVALAAIFFRARRYKAYSAGYAAARVKWSEMRAVFAKSLPVSLQMAFETSSFSIAAIMCGVLGKVPLAAYQIVVITGTLGFCIYYAVGAAVAVRVANAKGLGDNAGMRRSAWAGYHILLVIMVLSSATFIFAGRHIMGAFTNDEAVITVAVSLIFPLVLYQLGDATQINFANALRGTANVTPMLWIAFVSYIVVGLPATWLLCFPMGLGVYGVVLSFSVSLFLAAALFLYFFLRTARRGL